jgi:ParB family chromosome partitioning protein
MARKIKAALPGAVTRGTVATLEPPAQADPFGAAVANELRTVPLTLIDPDPDQPRKHFDPETLDAIAKTIRTHGVIQPPEVRETGEGRYILTDGEQRWRAAHLAEAEEMAVLVRPHRPPVEVLERQLVANIAREDLKPIETARALNTLMQELELSQTAVAARVGLGRVKVVQLLSLLNLPDAAQQLVDEGRLTFAHARSLNSLDDSGLATRLARRAADEEWSTRQLDGEVAKAIAEREEGPRTTPRRYPHADRDHLAREIEAALIAATKLPFSVKGRGEQITVSYTSDADGIRAYAAKLGAELPDPIG